MGLKWYEMEKRFKNSHQVTAANYQLNVLSIVQSHEAGHFLCSLLTFNVFNKFIISTNLQ